MSLDPAGLAEIEEIARRSTSRIDRSTILQSPDSRLFFAPTGPNMFLLDAAQQVGEALRRMPGVWRQEHHCVVLTPGCHATAYVGAQSFGRIVLNRVAQGKSVQSAIEAIERLVTAESASAGLYLLLRGAHVDQPVELGNGLSLIPIDLSQRTAFAGDDPPVLVSSALRVACTILRPIRPPDLGAAVPADMRAAARTLESASRVVALLCCPGAVAEHATTFAFDDPEMQALAPTAKSSPVGQPRSFILGSQTVVNGDELVNAWSRFLTMPENDRERIETASERLTRALVLLDLRPMDSCVELCIALETLFNDDASDSIKHKVTRRAARYLRTGLEDRKSVAQLLGKVYNARSGVVHGSAESNRKVSREERLLAASLLAQAARRMIDARAIPEGYHFDFTDGVIPPHAPHGGNAVDR